MKTVKPFTVIVFIFVTLRIFGQVTQPDTVVQLREFEISDALGKRVFQQGDTIGRASIGQMPVRDVGDFLRGQPNVAGVRKGGTGIDPVMRGFKYSQLNVQLNEGQKIEGACPNRMDPPTAHIDIEDIYKIELFRGPYALRFGPNFGGLIHLHTWPETRLERFEARVSAVTGAESAWGGFKQQLSVKTGNRNFLLRLSGNYKKYGDYRDGNGHTVNSSFERYNYSGLLSLTPADKHSFTLSYDHAIGKNLDFPALAMDERLDKTGLYALDYIYNDPGKAFQGLHVKTYFSDVSHEMDNKQRPVSDTTVAIATIDAMNTGYRVEATLSLLKGTWHLGSDMEEIRKDGDRVKYFIMQPTLPRKNEKLWDNAHIRNFGFFAEYARLIGRVTAVAAFRLDLNAADANPMTWENMQGQPVYQNDQVTSSHTNLSFSLGTEWRINRTWELGFSAGRGVRSPDMTERFIILLPIGYDNYDYIGTPSLLPEANHQADISLSWHNKKAGMVTASVFFSYVSDYITGQVVPQSVVKPQTKGVFGVKQFINADRAWLTGFELGYHTPAGKPWLLELVAGYTYGVNPFAQYPVIENGQVVAVEEVENDPLSEIPPLEGTVKFSRKFFGGKLVPKASLRAVAPQNHISKAYEERTSPGFVLAGLSVYYRFNDYLEVTAGVDNLFDAAYYEHLNRNIIGTKENFYEPGINAFINLKFKINT